MSPNVKRLIAHKMAVDAIPPGFGFGDGVDFLLSGKFAESGRNAGEWVKQAIAAVKSAPDNPYGDDDELIAAELLRRIDERSQNSDRH